MSIPNFDWEARLEEDNRNVEKAFGVFNRTLSRMAYSMWGTKLRIARLVLTFCRLWVSFYLGPISKALAPALC